MSLKEQNGAHMASLLFEIKKGVAEQATVCTTFFFFFLPPSSILVRVQSLLEALTIC